MDPKELMAKAVAAVKELETLHQAASTETDEAKAKALATDIEAKSAECDALETQVASAVKLADRQKRLIEAKQALTAIPPGNIADLGAPDPEPAKAKDHAVDERMKRQGVVDYCRGKKLSGQMQAALAPRSEKFSEEVQDGVALPRSMFQGMFGKTLTDKIWGKTNPLDSAGGQGVGEENLVPQEYIRQLLQLGAEPEFLLQMCTIIPTTSGTLTWPSLVQTDANEYGGVAMSWISEGAEKPETQPQFSQLEITAYELAGHTQLTHRLLSRSAISLETLLSTLFREACYHAMDTAFLVGTGVGQPLGVAIDAAVRQVPRVAVNAIEWTDLVNLATTVLRHHRQKGRFVLDATVEQALMLQHEAVYAAQPATNARPLFMPSVANGPYTRLIGYPYNVTYRTRNLGQTGDVIFGDWSKYLVGMEQDVVIKRSDHFEFTKNVATFIVYLVVGGRAGLPRAFSVLENATS